MFKFENLDAWKASIDLYRRVAGDTEKLTRPGQAFLAAHIRRTAMSISANIAEGTGREGLRGSKQFFNIAKGSTYEVVSIAYILREERVLTPAQFSEIYDRCDWIARMLSGLIRKRREG